MLPVPLRYWGYPLKHFPGCFMPVWIRPERWLFALRKLSGKAMKR